MKFKKGDIVKIKEIWLANNQIQIGLYKKHEGEVFKIIEISAINNDEEDKRYVYKLDTNDNSGWNWRELELATEEEYKQYTIMRKL